jgi:RNA polymerase sigma-70 factor (ECF subfamily)
MRARQRHPISTSAAGDPEAPAPETEDHSTEARDLVAMALRPFVLQLPLLYRDAVTMSELEGLPHAEIARRLGLSVSGVKSRVQRGRAQLRRDLERCCEIALDVRGTPVTCDLKPDGVVPAGCCCEGGKPPGE